MAVKTPTQLTQRQPSQPDSGDPEAGLPPIGFTLTPAQQKAKERRQEQEQIREQVAAEGEEDARERETVIDKDTITERAKSIATPTPAPRTVSQVVTKPTPIEPAATRSGTALVAKRKPTTKLTPTPRAVPQVLARVQAAAPEADVLRAKGKRITLQEVPGTIPTSPFAPKSTIPTGSYELGGTIWTTFADGSVQRYGTSDQTVAKISTEAAIATIPVVGTVAYWKRMSPAERLLSIGLDGVSLVVPAGKLLKSGRIIKVLGPLDAIKAGDAEVLKAAPRALKADIKPVLKAKQEFARTTIEVRDLEQAVRTSRGEVQTAAKESLANSRNLRAASSQNLKEAINTYTDKLAKKNILPGAGDAPRPPLTEAQTQRVLREGLTTEAFQRKLFAEQVAKGIYSDTLRSIAEATGKQSPKLREILRKIDNASADIRQLDSQLASKQISKADHAARVLTAKREMLQAENRIARGMISDVENVGKELANTRQVIKSMRASARAGSDIDETYLNALRVREGRLAEAQAGMRRNLKKLRISEHEGPGRGRRGPTLLRPVLPETGTGIRLGGGVARRTGRTVSAIGAPVLVPDLEAGLGGITVPQPRTQPPGKPQRGPGDQPVIAPGTGPTPRKAKPPGTGPKRGPMVTPPGFIPEPTIGPRKTEIADPFEKPTLMREPTPEKDPTPEKAKQLAPEPSPAPKQPKQPTKPTAPSKPVTRLTMREKAKTIPKRGVPLRLPSGEPIPSGQYPRVIQWAQGKSLISRDLVSGHTRFRRNPGDPTRTPWDTVTVLATSSARPRQQRLDLGAVDVLIRGKSLRFSASNDKGIQVFRLRQRPIIRARGIGRRR